NLLPTPPTPVDSTARTPPRAYHSLVRLPASGLIIPALCAVFGAACASPPRGFDSPVSDARLEAIGEAARTRDPAAIPHLIEMLESDDPAVRMASIRTLELITGQTLGYD